MMSKLHKNSLINKNVVIGNFDLLHKFHKQLFNLEDEYVILTFKNIPRKQDTDINSLKSKVHFLKKHHPKHIYYLDIAKNNMDAKQFVDRYLKKTKSIIVGKDFKFGSDFRSIFDFEHELNIKSLEINQVYSSTKIKSLLAKGDIKKANQLLIEPFAIYEKVVHGKKMGRKLGFRTANFDLNKNFILKSGVYLTKTSYRNKTYKSITMYGNPKTLKNDNKKIMETHIIDFDKIIYNKYIEISFYQLIAPVRKYQSKQELIKAINQFKQLAIKTNY